MADVSISSSSTDTVDVVGLNDIKADVKLELPQPFQTDSTSTLEVKPLKTDLVAATRVAIEPLKTDSSLAVDLKPAVVDLCLTLNVGKVPSLCIRQPYRHKIGFTLYGVEMWGFSFSGEQETIVHELAPRPQVATGGMGTAWPPPQAAPAANIEPPIATGGGLRVRLGS